MGANLAGRNQREGFGFRIVTNRTKLGWLMAFIEKALTPIFTAVRRVQEQQAFLPKGKISSQEKWTNPIVGARTWDSYVDARGKHLEKQ